jgi:orotidine-5'-phosphate decarboxylase
MTKIFCAIDTDDRDRAVSLAMQLNGVVDGVKLGLEYFAARGPEGVEEVRRAARGLKLFLDLKLHDIPNTVAGAVRGAVRCRADFLTIHASGGPEMLKAAVTAARDEEAKTGYAAPALLAVTVLTSLDAEALRAVGQEAAPEAQVLRLARLAAESGVQGLVCSPREIALLRRELGNMPLVVPGIRPATSDSGDQKRTMTPPEAAALGADWLVIGRPITEAKDPVRAARDIAASISVESKVTAA